MDLIHFLIDFILHIDVHLAELVAQYGVWVYAILFLILFCETGLVVTPFLPGDSLLFVAGALSALPTNDLNVHLMVLLMVIAAIVGDAVNYTIGRLFGEKLFSNPNSKIFRRSYLDKTHSFYERHGGKTIILARFVPIVRTFAPFVAEWGICPIVILQPITWLGRCCGCCCSPMPAICLAICRWCRRT
ncbi:DedA protein [Klebsiella pneumoniae]|nr:DedA protein [Klebsiella pneumoniae]